MPDELGRKRQEGKLRLEPATSSKPRPVDEVLQKAIDKTLYANGSPVAQHLRNFLNGTWLGDPLHSALIHVPIGVWTAAMVFDALELSRSPREFDHAADAAIAIGVAAAAVAAATGVVDWSDVDPPARRTGFMHGLLNLGATTMFTVSLALRRQGSRSSGRLVSTLGYLIMLYAGRLGGRMVYRYNVGVDRTAGEDYPQEFTPIFPASGLQEGKLTRADYGSVPILLVRRGERIFALAETCSHFCGPLSAGKLADDSVVCPYHASRFALEDGRVLDGPAVHPQPSLETRIRDGQIEVRRR